jgi:NAD(P)-dependent dehydrogenase (short-subunit alcohol dehydrogenase family)
MGRALARLMAERGDEVFLLGRDADELTRSARDLELRGGQGGHVGWALCDLERPELFGAALDAAGGELGEIDAVVVTAGLFAGQQAMEEDPLLAARLLRVDFAHTVLFCEEARRRLLARGGGTLCVFSSVAGERGRKPVVLYGAAKAGLTRYLEGLDHRYHDRGLSVVCVKPGFVKTGMTAGLKPPPFASEADEVARRALAAIDRGKSVVYGSPPWALIACALRWLPRAVMRRVEF